jgi:hypothetical protein
MGVKVRTRLVLDLLFLVDLGDFLGLILFVCFSLEADLSNVSGEGHG